MNKKIKILILTILIGVSSMLSAKAYVFNGYTVPNHN